MHDDVVSTRSTGFGVGETPPVHDDFLEDRGFSSYARGVYAGIGRGSRRATQYISSQYQQQPVVLGTAAAAAVGTAAGILIARSQVRRRRKSDAERIADAVTAIPDLLFSRIPPVDMDEIRHRSSDVLEATRHKGGEIAEAAIHRGSAVLGTTREMGSALAEKAPEMSGRPRMAGMTGDFGKKVRGGVQLVPIAITLMRNPLVRDMIARSVTRRASKRRGSKR